MAVSPPFFSIFPKINYFSRYIVAYPDLDPFWAAVLNTLFHLLWPKIALKGKCLGTLQSLRLQAPVSFTGW